MTAHEQPVLYSVDFRGCSTICDLTPDDASAIFVRALQNAGATVMQTTAHHFPGAGLTCVLILAESHAVLHTWPETGTVNIDIFSCSSRLDSLMAIADMGRAFGAASVSIQEILRADGHSAARDPRN